MNFLKRIEKVVSDLKNKLNSNELSVNENLTNEQEKLKKILKQILYIQAIKSVWNEKLLKQIDNYDVVIEFIDQMIELQKEEDELNRHLKTIVQDDKNDENNKFKNKLEQLLSEENREEIKVFEDLSDLSSSIMVKFFKTENFLKFCDQMKL